MDSISMTEHELRALRDDLNQLETTGRAQIAARIKTAREWGDLKENGEYHAAKEAQAHLETRILRLREQLRSAVVVQRTDSDEVQHGSAVKVTDLGAQSQREFTIVAPNDADPAQGMLSVASPMAQALIGRRVGDVVEVGAPAGVRKLRVDAIS